MRHERREFKFHGARQLISYRGRFGRFDQNTLVGMHHPNKDLVGMSGEMAAAVTKDCFGFNPEIELPAERRHALAQKFQWPETGQPPGHAPLHGVQKTNKAKCSGVAPNVLQVRKPTALPVPHAKRSGQSIHRVSIATEKHPLAANVRGSMLRECQERFTLSALHPARYEHACALVYESGSVDGHTLMFFESSQINDRNQKRDPSHAALTEDFTIRANLLERDAYFAIAVSFGEQDETCIRRCGLAQVHVMQRPGGNAIHVADHDVRTPQHARGRRPDLGAHSCNVGW